MLLRYKLFYLFTYNPMENFENSLDLSVFWELWDNNARAYIEAKYGIETRELAEKALRKFDAEQGRDFEAGQNLGVFPFWYRKSPN
jgi:hypothetical protein